MTSAGTSITGIHQASRMLPSIAPTRIAIFSPSPVLVLIETGCVRGPRVNARTIASFHSNPPVARMTLAGAHLKRPITPNETHTVHGAIAHDQLGRAGFGSRLDTAIQAGL